MQTEKSCDQQGLLLFRHAMHLGRCLGWQFRSGHTIPIGQVRHIYPNVQQHRATESLDSGNREEEANSRCSM